jgi:hypothetical protein
MRSRPLQVQSTKIVTYIFFIIIIIFCKLETAKYSPIFSSSTAAAAAASSSPSSSSSSSSSLLLPPPPPLLLLLLSPLQLQQRKWLNCKRMSSSSSNSKFPATKTAI